MTDTRIDTIERTLELRASPERVWSALVDKEQLERWWGGGAGAIEPDTESWFDWPDEGRFAYRVEAFEPLERLTYRWARDPDVAIDAGLSTLVEFTLERRHDGGTTLHLRESGFNDERHHDENVEGWAEELEKLRAVLDGDNDRAR